MTVRPYRLIGARTTKRLHEAIATVVSAWADDWLSEKATFSVEAITALNDRNAGHKTLQVDKYITWLDDNWCALISNPKLYPHLGAILLGIPSSRIDVTIEASTIVNDIVSHALIELAQRLLAGTTLSYDAVASCVTQDPIPKTVSKRGSGSIAALFAINGVLFEYVLSPATVDRYISLINKPVQNQKNPLIPAIKALGKQKVHTSIYLGTAVLPIQDLASVRVGDVILLDNTIDKPSSLVFNSSSTKCTGTIGRQKNSYAFRVTGMLETESSH